MNSTVEEDLLAGQIQDFVNKIESTKSSETRDAFNLENLPRYIDHTLLKTSATPEQIDVLCKEAKEWAFKAVCVRVNFVVPAVKLLQGSESIVCCVIGFPEGTQIVQDKIQEATEAIQLGARELDTVLNVPDMHSKRYGKILSELKAFRHLCLSASPQVCLKLILETSQLSQQEVIAACKLASLADFDFVKTSTGFLGHGATVEHVKLMKTCSTAEGKGMLVKASGGIRSMDDAIAMIEAGADRLGVSAGVAIMEEIKARQTA